MMVIQLPRCVLYLLCEFRCCSSSSLRLEAADRGKDGASYGGSWTLSRSRAGATELRELELWAGDEASFRVRDTRFLLFTVDMVAITVFS
jgi:hypothetical protein